MKQKVQYKEVNLKAGGKRLFPGDYGAKAFAVTFVYSNKGNFLIRGFWGETEMFLNLMVQNGYRFFYQYSFYKDGKARFTHTKFWNNRVYVLAPEKRNSEYSQNRNKYEFRKSQNGKSVIIFSYKRLPKKWLPEMENL